jgi:hypothetical protein
MNWFRKQRKSMRRKTTDPKWVSIEIRGLVPWEPRASASGRAKPFFRSLLNLKHQSQSFAGQL